MLQPARSKYRKQMKGRLKGLAHRGSNVAFGAIGIAATEKGLVTAREIEAARVAMTRYIKRGGRVWIRLFPDKPVCKKPLETRMGKGKGAPDHYVAVVKPGRILFEIDGVEEAEAREGFRLAANKLSVKTKVVVRTEGGL